MNEHNDSIMGLNIKMRKLGNSLIVTISKEICEMYGLKEGTILEFLPDKNDFCIHIKGKKDDKTEESKE